jgi:Putative transposase
LLGYDKALCAEVLAAFTHEVQRSLRHRAKKMLRLRSMSEAHTGGVTFIQRFDSALRLNVHFHSLFLDGVFVRDEDGELEFHELDEPSPEQVADVAARTARRVIKLLERAGKSLDSELSDEEVDDFVQRQPALASLYAAAARGVDLSGERAGQPTMRLIQQDSVRNKEPHAIVGGINIHAAVAFDARDKPRMERMCRYLARPPIAQHRLTRRPDGSLRYEMKKAWRDGTHAILLQPLDLIARLCAMIPPPRFNMIRFHGVFAPNAKLRAEVVPQKEPRKLATHSAAELGDAEQTHLFEDEQAKPKRHPWAWLLKKVFLVDVTECPECGGRMKWLEVCTERRDIHRVLSAHGLAPRAPPQVGWTPLGQLRFSF